MFPNNLCTEIVRQIFEYDCTYKEVFNKVLDTLVTPSMKALQYFLRQSTLSEFTDERAFEGMREFELESMGIDNNFIEMRHSGKIKTAYFVMTWDDKSKLDDPFEPASTLVVKHFLHTLPVSTIALFIDNMEEDMIRSKLQEEGGTMNEEDRNAMIYEMLGPDGYTKLILHLIKTAIYNKLLHRYIFETLFRSLDDIYFIEDSDNYHYFRYNCKFYMVLWNVYTSTLFM